MGVLQGTFDTLSLTEVLGLLAQSRKSGALWLEAGSVHGRVYLDGGRCCAAESDEVTAPLEHDDGLSQRLVDVCFSVARHSGGSFRFVVDEEPPWKATAVKVDEAVDRLGSLLEEWHEIQAVIPSLQVRPVLAPELGTDSIIVDQDRWRLLVNLDGHRTVRDVMSATERSVLDICNALKELVEEGAVDILPEAPEPIAAPAPPAPEALAVAEPVAAEAFQELAAVAAPMPDPFADVDEHHGDASVSYDDTAAPEAAEGAPDGAEPGAEAGAVDAVDAAGFAEPGQPGDGTELDPAADADADAFAPGDAAPADDQPLPPPPLPGETTADADADAAAVAAGAGLDEGDPRDRGALLRLFSALRDT
jgi:hypothetical protein